MRLTKRNLLIGAIVLSESAWIYALLNAYAAAGSYHGPPLTFPAIAGLIIAGMFFRKWTKEWKALEVTFLLEAAIFVTLLYLLISVHVTADRVDLTWITRLFAYGTPESFRPLAISAIIAGVLLWWRGRRLAVGNNPAMALSIGFRVGIVVLGAVTIVDLINPRDLNTLPMIVLFFAAGLGGLNTGFLVTESKESAKAKTWPKMTAIAVLSVLVIGLIFGTFNQTLLAFLARPVTTTVSTIAKAIAVVLFAPFFFVYDLANRALEAFFSRPFNPEPAAVATSTDGFITVTTTFATTTSQTGGGSTNADWVTTLVWIAIGTLAVALFAFVCYLIYKVVQVMFNKEAPPSDEGEKESVRDDADLGTDLGGLLRNLLPNFSFGRKKKGFNIPDGPPGIVEILRLYYQMITSAEENEVKRRPHDTPNEFQPALGQVFPPDLVREATAAFNQAMYGHTPSADDRVSHLKSTYKTAESTKPKPPKKEPPTQGGGKIRSSVP